MIFMRALRAHGKKVFVPAQFRRKKSCPKFYAVMFEKRGLNIT